MKKFDQVRLEVSVKVLKGRSLSTTELSYLANIYAEIKCIIIYLHQVGQFLEMML